MGIRAARSDDGNTLEIHVGERFELSQHKACRDAYADMDVTRMRVRVNLRSTRYMDSSALGMLLVLRERAGGDRADVTLCGAAPGVLQVLTVSRFQQMLKLE
jgi:HptB-dependent secretion and biofilm anti anti-sigma factor